MAYTKDKMPAHRKNLEITGPNLWYLVGLITTDGCLSSDGRHIDITSKNREFLKTLKHSLGLSNKIGIKNKDEVNESYRIELSNRNFYEFLLSVGLTPCKSLTQDEVIVPDEFFADFLRGVIDGDGCIRRWEHSGNRGEQWSLRIYSPSLIFVEWLYKEIKYIFKVDGRIHRQEKERPLVDMFVLKYGKMAAQVIFNKCYYKDALSLERKARLAEKCCASSAGWGHAKTVFN